MNNPTDDAPVVDADVVPSTSDASAGDNAAQVLLDLESMIKSNVAVIDKSKIELKKQKEMLNSALENDETYRLHSEEAKKAAKQKGATKIQIIQQPSNRALDEKVKTLAAEIKEATAALSDYLREYARISGTNEIETDDGQVREIVYTARLVKKTSR